MVDTLPDDARQLKAILIAERARNDWLLPIIKELQRHRFGRRAESLPEDQMLLGLEEVEQAAAAGAARAEETAPAERAARTTSLWARRPLSNRSAKIRRPQKTASQ